MSSVPSVRHGLLLPGPRLELEAARGLSDGLVLPQRDVDGRVGGAIDASFGERLHDIGGLEKLAAGEYLVDRGPKGPSLRPPEATAPAPRDDPGTAPLPGLLRHRPTVDSPGNPGEELGDGGDVRVHLRL